MAGDAIWWAIGLAMLGAIFGSFVAALVTRWPAGRSVVAGRSACDACGHRLRARDLVPVASYVGLRRRCRDCGGTIDPSHLAIELLGIVIGVAAGWVAPGPVGVAGAVFGWLLLALAALDLAAFWLPDRLTAPLALIGLVTGGFGLPPDLPDRIAGGVVGFGVLWLIALGYRRWRGREGLGGGDAKLLGAIGLWLGWRPLPAVLLLGCLIGLGVVAWRALTGRRIAGDDRLPLGTLLAVAAYLLWLAMVAPLA